MKMQIKKKGVVVEVNNTSLKFLMYDISLFF